MKFRNKSDETLDVPSLQREGVAPGDVVEPSPAYASGFALQCGDDGVWEPADDEAKTAVADAEAAAEAAQSDDPPLQSASKGEWVAYAETHGAPDVDYSSQTKQQLIDQFAATSEENG